MAAEDTSLSGLAGRYARALLELAEEASVLDQVADDLGRLEAAIAESDDLRRLIASPLYGREQQGAVLGAVAEKLGVQDLTRRFVLLVAHNRRLFTLPRMIRAYLEELARRRGEVTAEVTSALALDAEQRRALTDALKAELGAKVRVDLKVDKSLLGGLIVRVGSRMFDSSLRNKLQRLQLAMKGVG